MGKIAKLDKAESFATAAAAAASMNHVTDFSEYVAELRKRWGGGGEGANDACHSRAGEERERENQSRR